MVVVDGVVRSICGRIIFYHARKVIDGISSALGTQQRDTIFEAKKDAIINTVLVVIKRTLWSQQREYIHCLA